jgi:hypothetical protein
MTAAQELEVLSVILAEIRAQGVMGSSLGLVGAGWEVKRRG